jgi:YegS/Rv2252/BmrU family lipid kinase
MTPQEKNETDQSPAVPAPKIKHVHVIINPAAGQQEEPVLKTLNAAFQEMGLEWEILITKSGGDARRYAEEAVAAGVDAVAAYGGDGTVLEVASGLRGSKVPLAILPGGTANVLSVELGIPRTLADALALLGSQGAALRPVDMGEVNDQLFFHLGLGLEGEMVHKADREAKDQSGLMAYVTALVKEIRNPPVACYHLTLDGEEVEVEGVNCMVTNFGSIGVAGLKLSHAIDMSDGLMDVLVIRDVDVRSLLSAVTNAITSGDIAEPMLQWQAREVKIEVDPPQRVTCDGEVIEGLTRIEARIIPGAIQVLVPLEATSD